MDLVPIYILNLIIVVGMFIVTIYRAWIEKQNLQSRRRVEELKMILEKEKEAIKTMTGEDFIDMLKTVLS